MIATSRELVEGNRYEFTPREGGDVITRVQVKDSQSAERGHQARTSILGHWKITRLEDAPADKLQGASAMIDDTSIFLRVPLQKRSLPVW